MWFTFKAALVTAILVFTGWMVITEPTPYGAPYGCFTTNGPVPAVCVENYNTPRCATEDGNDGVSDCWWIDPKDLKVWYQPR